jgi:hypothetical protein
MPHGIGLSGFSRTHTSRDAAHNAQDCGHYSRNMQMCRKFDLARDRMHHYPRLLTSWSLEKSELVKNRGSTDDYWSFLTVRNKTIYLRCCYRFLVFNKRILKGRKLKMIHFLSRNGQPRNETVSALLLWTKKMSSQYGIVRVNFQHCETRINAFCSGWGSYAKRNPNKVDLPPDQPHCLYKS